MKKGFCFLLILSMLLGMFAGVPTEAYAASVSQVSSASALKSALTSGRGGSIRLTKDISGFSSGAHISKGTYTLDLNGHKLSGKNDKDSLIFVSGGSLTIKDGSKGKKGSIVNSGTEDAAGCESGTLTISGGTLKGGTYAVFATGGKIKVSGGTLKGSDYGIMVKGGSLTIKSGTIQATGQYGNGVYTVSKEKAVNVTISGGKIKGANAVFNGTPGTLKVTGGTIAGEFTGIRLWNGNLSVSGGTITATDGTGIEICGLEEMTPEVVIKGGTITGNGSSGRALDLMNVADIRITGGSFSGQWYDLIKEESFRGVLEYPEGTFETILDNSREGQGISEDEFHRVDLTYTPGMEITDADSLFSLCMFMMDTLTTEVEFYTTEHLLSVLDFYEDGWFGRETLKNRNMSSEFREEEELGKITYSVEFGLEYEVSAVLRDSSLSAQATEEANRYAKQMRKIKKQIITAGMTKKQKIQAVHDYMVKNYSYDYDFGPNCHEFYAMLDDKKGVCEAYARLFMLFMDMLGIRCQCVTGMAASGPGKTDYEGHMWNRVELSGKWYYIDVTFDDTSGSKQFYMLTEKEFYGKGVHLKP